MHITKKTVLITGSSRGIGESILNLFFKNLIEYNIICVSKTFKIYELNFKKYNKQLFGFCVDVSNYFFVKMLSKKITFLGLNGVDILINNAGIIRDNLILKMSVEDWDLVIKTNLYSCFFFIKFFVKKMLTKRWGRIINVSSVVAIIGNAGQLNYITSKAGILGLTKGLAKEVSQRNITINSILPGFIETEMTKFINESTIKLIKNFIPSRKFGLPEDIAYSIKFLCSESANYINGHSLVIDGGLSVY